MSLWQSMYRLITKDSDASKKVYEDHKNLTLFLKEIKNFRIFMHEMVKKEERNTLIIFI